MKFVRPAINEEKEELAAIYYHCREEADWLPIASKLKANFEEDTDGEEIYIYVTQTGKIAGFVSIWMPESFIHHLYVHPEMRGQGVAMALLKHLDGHVKFPWTLKCSQANQQALDFYTSRGWQTIDAVPSCEEPYFLLEFDPQVQR